MTDPSENKGDSGYISSQSVQRFCFDQTEAERQPIILAFNQNIDMKFDH